MRIIIALLIITSATATAGENKKTRRPYLGGYPNNVVGIGPVSHNSVLYTLGNKAAEIYQDNNLNEQDKQFKVSNLLIPGDKIIIETTPMSSEEKEFYGMKVYMVKTKIDFGENGHRPVSIIYYSLSKPASYKQKYELLVHKARFNGKITPELTIWALELNAACIFAVNNAAVKF